MQSLQLGKTKDPVIRSRTVELESYLRVCKKKKAALASIAQWVEH